MKHLILVLILLSIPGVGHARNFWVSPSGANVPTCFDSPTQPSSIATQASRTINQGLQCLTAQGDVLNILAGTYNERITINKTTNTQIPNGTNYTNAVVIQGVGALGTVILMPPNVSGGAASVTIGNPCNVVNVPVGCPSIDPSNSYIILRNFRIDGTNASDPSDGSGAGIYYYNTSDHIRADGIDIGFHQRISGDAILNGGNFNEFINGFLHDSYSYGFYIGGPNFLLENNKIYNNGQYGGQIYQSHANTGNKILRNEIWNNGLLNDAYCEAIQAYGAGADDALIANNLVRNARCAGISVAGAVNRVTVINNTVYGMGGAGITGSGADATTIRNNIFSNNAGGDYAFTGTGTVSNNNLCSSGSCGGAPSYVETASNTFVNPPSNLHLKAGSLAIDHGTNTGCPTTDYAGTPRPQQTSCDIGAYEYGAPATFVPTVTWTNDRGGSGTASLSGSNPTNWQTDVPPSGIPLKAGINNITVTATDNTGATATYTITITYAPTFPGNTLALAYGFEEASGNAVDSSGNSNTGALFNGPTRLIGSGKFGNGISLNGFSQYIAANSASSLDFTQSFTFSAYVRPHLSYSDFRPLMIKEITGGKGYVQFLYATVAGYCGSGRVLGGFTANGSLGPTFAACDTTTAIPTGGWTHMAVTYNNATQELKLYKNGVPIATTIYSNSVATATPPSGYMEPSTGQLRIGAVPAFGEFLDADVDEVRTYNWAIPATDGKLNTVFGNPCGYRTDTVANAAADRLNMALVSIMGDANCAVIQPVAPTGPALKIPQAPSGVKVSSGSTMKLSQ